MGHYPGWEDPEYRACYTKILQGQWEVKYTWDLGYGIHYSCVYLGI